MTLPCNSIIRTVRQIGIYASEKNYKMGAKVEGK